MPKSLPSASTDTEVATHVHRLCVQPQGHDTDALRQVVWDIIVKVGHGHLLPELEDESKECSTITSYYGIARQAISYSSGLCTANIWLTNGRQPQHKGAIQANILPCTCGPE